jgi:hypothetical protein
MSNKKIIGFGFLSAACVCLYVWLVAFFMNHASNWFGTQDKGVLTPMLALMLLVLSAAIVGTLVFGLPVYVFLSGDKKGGIKQLFFNLLWLFVFVMIFVVILALI